ncbi:uncharacterized protein LOC131438139 isoform X2 [Malaya genurostris]|uniref:uncharacterized protein LOC131438139 isoform X2 n=1 Tax=Malaya genurostris TaxID=325434 RepID=UPI0026F3F58F|nr:uncharacterized protein LOC131438139 isoform X2 [Malaya genurostris]
MTRLCSPWDYSQSDEYPADDFAQFLHPSSIDNKEMDEMLVQCNKNSVYVLNSSYRYRDFDMIELFGSPAGRALTVNNKTAAEMHSCSKTSSSINNSISSCTNSTSHHPLSQQPLYHPFQNCGFSGTCSTISTGLSHETHSNGDLIRYRTSTHPQQQNPSHPTTNYSTSNRTNSKIAKIWKLFDEDRIRKEKSNNAGSSTNGKISGSDIFSRCHRQKHSSAQMEAKTTKDLYNEAAQLLGIKCTLSDSCRCIDCQSQYFDCDDFDSYSEYSDKSCDLEDTSIINQSYFTVEPNQCHLDNLTATCHSRNEVVNTNQRPVSSTGIGLNFTNPNSHLEEAETNPEKDINQDDNGNNGYCQYSIPNEPLELGPPDEDNRFSVSSKKMTWNDENRNELEQRTEAEVGKLEENGNWAV